MVDQFALAVVASLIAGRIAQTLNPRTSAPSDAIRPRRNARSRQPFGSRR